MTKLENFFVWATRILVVGMLGYGVWHMVAGSPKAARYIITGALVVTLVLVVSRFANKLVPSWLLLFIAVFMVLASCLGFGYNMYEKWWPWDDLMHGISGFLFGLVGVMLVERMCAAWSPKLPVWIRVCLATLFAVFIAVLWELLEFGSDLFLGSFLQQADLYDTMVDLWLGSIWGLVAAGAYYAVLPAVKRTTR